VRRHRDNRNVTLKAHSVGRIIVPDIHFRFSFVLPLRIAVARD
jgi:hypothetical protein